MFRKETTEYVNPACVELVLETLVGGGVLKDGQFVSDEAKSGTIVGIDSDGLIVPFKTAKIYEDFESDATAIKIYKEHELSVGSVLTKSGLAGAAIEITAIDTSDENYDALTITTGGFGAAGTAGDIYVEASAAADAGSAALAVTPEGVIISTVALDADNRMVGVMVRGRLNGASAPYYVDSNVASLLPLIRITNLD